MSLDRFITAWIGTVYRHIPQNSPFGVLDFRFAALASENRWNLPGQPTLYLAADAGVALAEYARHFQEHRTPELGRQIQARQLYRLQLRVEALLDLRAPAVWDELSLTNAPYCFLDRGTARAVAGYVRAATATQAVLVPSMVFLDDLSRWSLVLFLDRLPPDPSEWLSAEPAEVFRIE